MKGKTKLNNNVNDRKKFHEEIIYLTSTNSVIINYNSNPHSHIMKICIIWFWIWFYKSKGKNLSENIRKDRHFHSRTVEWLTLIDNRKDRHYKWQNGGTKRKILEHFNKLKQKSLLTS